MGDAPARPDTATTISTAQKTAKQLFIDASSLVVRLIHTKAASYPAARLSTGKISRKNCQRPVAFRPMVTRSLAFQINKVYFNGVAVL